MNDAIGGLQAARAGLIRQRDRVDQQIAALDEILSTLGGGGGGAAAPARRGPGRPPGSGRGPGRPPGRPAGRPAGGGGFRSGSLKDHINQVLRGGGTMAVKDITARVMRSGYKTKNKTLAKSVGIALTEMTNVEKVGRGKFRIKGAA